MKSLALRKPWFAFHHHVLHVLGVEVADDALDQVAFLIDAGRRVGGQGLFADRVPQPQQIVIVAPDLQPGAVLARGADDQAHAFGQFQPLGGAFQALAVGGVGDLAGNAAAARGVGHQHAIAAGQRQIGGERRALVAAFFLDHLHQDDLAALDDFLNLVVLLAHPFLRRALGLQGLGVLGRVLPSPPSPARWRLHCFHSPGRRFRHPVRHRRKPAGSRLHFPRPLRRRRPPLAVIVAQRLARRLPAWFRDRLRLRQCSLALAAPGPA